MIKVLKSCLCHLVLQDCLQIHSGEQEEVFLKAVPAVLSKYLCNTSAALLLGKQPH